MFQVFLERRDGAKVQTVSEDLDAAPKVLRLGISAEGSTYSFHYDTGQGWKHLRKNESGWILSTAYAGGFVGTVLGPYARQE